MKKKNYLLPVLFGVFAVVLVTMIVALCLPHGPQKGDFVPPSFEADAVLGLPEVDEGLGYQELYREGMAYRVALCGAPTVEEKSLTVYFTNAAANEKWLKLRVLDSSGKTVGETGLLRPGEYVRAVALSRPVTVGEALQLKVMGYEPETYEGAGAVTLNVTARPAA